MVEIITSHNQPTQEIVSPGDPKEIWGIKSAKSFKSWLQNRLNDRIRQKNKEYEMVLKYILNAYNHFHPVETISSVELEGWKGKDEIEFLEKPDSIDIITHQKKDKDSKPKEIVRNVTKKEINQVINAINKSRKKKDKDGLEYSDTSSIAENFCISTKLLKNKKGYDLFPNGQFEWDNFFADRGLHTNLNLILRLLDRLLVIRYRAAKTYVLKPKFSFQTTL